MADKVSKGFKIGEISNIKKIDKQTLRYYDKIGLLKPEIVDPNNGYRYYSIEQFMDVDLIQFHKHLGLTLKEMKDFREIKDIQSSIEALKIQHHKLISKIQSLNEIEKNISKIINDVEYYTEYMTSMDYSITLKNSMEIRGIVGESPNEKGIYNIELTIGSAVEKVDDEISHYHNFGMFFEHDLIVSDEIALGETSRVIIPIDLGDREVIDTRVSTIKIGKHLEVIIRGGRTGFEKHNKAIIKWIKNHNYKMVGKIYLKSIVSSFIVDNDKEQITKLIIPIE
ncbi:MAG: MerR family transcriptional regulator [Firmicutes bacterium]|jgi:DNA-binding transcriptional MerR regulator/effector-binding domain-containing protein|nr:MerR family transcriptional regulator [Bacillota bacterium]